MLRVEDIGEIIAQNIVEYFADEENLQEIQKLFDIGVKIKETKTVGGDKLGGKVFVLTGVLSKPRSEFEKMIEDNGGKTSSSVSKNTDYCLAGEDAGSKLDKAKKLGIKIINEQEFLNMLGK